MLNNLNLNGIQINNQGIVNGTSLSQAAFAHIAQQQFGNMQVNLPDGIAVNALGLLTVRSRNLTVIYFYFAF